MRSGDERIWGARELPRKPHIEPTELPILGRLPGEPVSLRRYTVQVPGTVFVKWKPPKLEPPPPVQCIPIQAHIDENPQNRQVRIASDIRKILSDEDGATQIERATLRFLDAFREGIPLGEAGLDESLMNVAVQLSQSCITHGKFKDSEMILDVVLSCGTIDEEAFLLFNPEALIRACVMGKQDPTKGHKTISEERLRKGCALFLTKYKNEVNKASAGAESWGNLGVKLCIETHRLGLFDLTEDVYWRMSKYSDSACSRAVKYLVTAVNQRGDYKRAIQYFQRFYLQTSPSQEEFYEVVKALSDSIMNVSLPNYKLAEEVLLLAFDMAERQHLKVSTTCLLKLLGSHWRTHRDIFQAKETFESFKTYFQLMGHPQALYGALIQFYVEVEDETSATTLYEEMRATYPPNPGDVRIYGHFAFYKAMRKDWEGVKLDFVRMRHLNPDVDELSAAFSPILSLFAKSESIDETEGFLRYFIDQLGILLTPHMSNIMIEKYLQSKEIDSVSRWVDYMRVANAPIDPALFNVILMNCYRKWMFSFDEIYLLYQKVKVLGKWTNSFINHGTQATLRHIAISASGNNVDLATSRLDLLDAIPYDSFLGRKDVRETMETALAQGAPRDALKIYNQALAANLPLDASTISIAVKASLRLYPESIEATAILLKKSSRNGQDISGALSSIFIHQLSTFSDQETGSCHLQKVARDTMNALERQRLPIPVRSVTHTMSVLCKKGQYRPSIDFWASMTRLRALPTDIETLTVLLQAYLALEDSAGLEWVVQMLRENDIIPDSRFKMALKNARKRVRRWGFLEDVAHTLEIIMEMRAVARQDKEIVKAKTITIMEKAMKIQNRSPDFEIQGPAISSNIEANTDVTSKPRMDTIDPLGVKDVVEDEGSKAIKATSTTLRLPRGVIDVESIHPLQGSHM
jgi:tetratricopeptide (TPR) repeat protein